MSGDIFDGGIAWGLYSSQYERWLVVDGGVPAFLDPDDHRASRWETAAAAEAFRLALCVGHTVSLEVRPLSIGGALTKGECSMSSAAKGPQPPQKVPDRPQKTPPPGGQQGGAGEGQQAQQGQEGAGQGLTITLSAQQVKTLPPFVQSLLAALIAFLTNLMQGNCPCSEADARQLEKFCRESLGQS